VRQDIEGGGAAATEATLAPKRSIRSVFVVEKNEKFQDAFRSELKKRGYRVFVAADPSLAFERFLLQPFDGLLVNAATMSNGPRGGEEGRETFERIMKDAEIQDVTCAGILIVAPEQERWKEVMPEYPRSAVFPQNVTIRQVVKKLEELLAED